MLFSNFKYEQGVGAGLDCLMRDFLEELIYFHELSMIAYKINLYKNSLPLFFLLL